MEIKTIQARKQIEWMKSVKNFVCILHLFNDLIIMHNKNPNRDFWEAIYKNKYQSEICLGCTWYKDQIYSSRIPLHNFAKNNIIVIKTKNKDGIVISFASQWRQWKVCDFNDRIVNPSFLIKHTEFQEENWSNKKKEHLIKLYEATKAIDWK